MSAHSPLGRLALPLCLSVLAHAGLLGVLAVVREPESTETADPDWRAAPLTIGLVSLEQPSPQPKPAADNEDDWQPVLGKALHPEHAAETDAGAAPVPIASTASGALLPGSPTSAVPAGGDRGLLAAPPTARRIVYLLDCSVSMGPSGALAVGRREIVASLRRLPPGALFQVIPYNQLAEPFPLEGRRTDLAPAAPAVVEEAVRLLDDVKAAGRTDHAGALRCALRLQPRPDAIFLVTDAGDMELAHSEPLVRLFQAGPALHVVELSRSRPEKSDLLHVLAKRTAGSFRWVSLDR